MVAQSIGLPNIRKLFTPSPGHIIVDADLSGADARVVAWEANDHDLMNAFESGLKVHLKNARDVFPTETQEMSDAEIQRSDHPGGIYHNCKRAVHATNYGGKPATIASACGWSTAQASKFQDRWLYDLHPAIAEWHDRVEFDLSNSRTVSNRFGYRRVYFDRIEGLLPEALAWTPQSTVALVTVKAAIQLYERRPEVQLLSQVHDSLIFQLPYSRREDLPGIIKDMEVAIPYDDPLIIPWGVKYSAASWGDCS